MTGNIVLKIYGVALFFISIPFTIWHLKLHPNFSFFQRIAAALENFFGPWSGLIMRIVDFPNAGLRSFSLPMALAMTLLGAVLIGLPLYAKKRWVQYPCIFLWMYWVFVWFSVGLIPFTLDLL